MAVAELPRLEEVLDLDAHRNGDDLGDLDLDRLTARFRDAHARFALIGHKSLDLAYTVGQVLEHVHARIGKRKWASWCANEDLEKRTADRYIAFRRAVGNRDALSHLPPDVSVRGAMALLAPSKESVPAIERPPFPVATPADVVLEVLDAGTELPDRVTRAIRRSPREGVDLVVTSWPYCLGESRHGYVDYGDYDRWLEEAQRWAATLKLICAPRGRVVVNVPIDIFKDQPRPRPIAADALQVLRGVGFAYKGTIVWTKGPNSHRSNTVARGSVRSPNAPALATGDELLLVVHKGEEWNLGRPAEPNDLDDESLHWGNTHWEINGETDTRYPHVLPRELVNRVMRFLSYPGDLMADLHCGRGTVAVEALRTGRTFVGGDVNPYAVALASQEVEAAWSKMQEARAS